MSQRDTCKEWKSALVRSCFLTQAELGWAPWFVPMLDFHGRSLDYLFAALKIRSRDDNPLQPAWAVDGLRHAIQRDPEPCRFKNASSNSPKTKPALRNLEELA
jgi:hypothetical protein